MLLTKSWVWHKVVSLPFFNQNLLLSWCYNLLHTTLPVFDPHLMCNGIPELIICLQINYGKWASVSEGQCHLDSTVHSHCPTRAITITCGLKAFKGWKTWLIAMSHLQGHRGFSVTFPVKPTSVGLNSVSSLLVVVCVIPVPNFETPHDAVSGDVNSLVFCVFWKDWLFDVSCNKHQPLSLPWGNYAISRCDDTECLLFCVAKSWLCVPLFSLFYLQLYFRISVIAVRNHKNQIFIQKVLFFLFSQLYGWVSFQISHHKNRQITAFRVLKLKLSQRKVARNWSQKLADSFFSG